ncbi:MAG: hypothetical protein ACOZNI_33170 [Myxococcota bacterium]
MAWIRTPKPPPDALRAAREAMPPEYGVPMGPHVPEAVRRESIVMSHALAPDVMRGVFSGFAAMMAPDLPLTRVEHELIATVVSGINHCFY